MTFHDITIPLKFFRCEEVALLTVIFWKSIIAESLGTTCKKIDDKICQKCQHMVRQNA